MGRIIDKLVRGVYGRIWFREKVKVDLEIVYIFFIKKISFKVILKMRKGRKDCLFMEGYGNIEIMFLFYKF